MEFLLLTLRLLLAIVFVVAGVAKLFDLSDSRQAMRDFGLPATLAAPAGLLLPLVELTIAGLLLPATTAWWGALVALGLLLAFVGGIVYNMARGRTPNCHCFGQLHSQPIGWPTLLRNGALGVIAGIVVAQGQADAGPSLIGWLVGLSPLGYLLLAGWLLLVTLVMGLGWTVFNLLRQNGRLLLRVETLESHLGLSNPTSNHVEQPAPLPGLPVGTPAPAFNLPTLAGGSQSLTTLLSPTKPLLLIFSSPTCGPCRDLLPEIAQWQHTHAAKLTIALVNRGDADTVRAKTDGSGVANLLLQAENEVGDAYKSTGTPSAVLIDREGLVHSPLAAGTIAIRALVSQTVNPLAQARDAMLRRAPIQLENGNRPQSAQAQGPDLGTPAPAIRLPNLTGETVDLTQRLGSPTLLLFWNPGCGFCRRMVDDLKAWEAQAAAGAPRLVLLATGSAEANLAVGLQSPILLDPSFSIGNAFGARGTPSAILLDGQNRVASRLVVGAPGIMALLQGSPTALPATLTQPVAA